MAYNPPPPRGYEDKLTATHGEEALQETAMSRLNDAVDRLTKEVAALEDRLNPVLGPHRSPPAKAGVDSPSVNSAHRTQIEIATLKLIEAKHNLREIAERFDL